MSHIPPAIPTPEPGVSVSTEVLRRITEVRTPIRMRRPRGYLTVGLEDTLAALTVPVAIVGGLVVVGHLLLNGIPTTLEGWLALILR